MIKEHDSSFTKSLKKIKIAERTHFYLPKMIIVVSSLLTLFTVSVIRKDIFHIPGLIEHFEKCSTTDYVICSAFILITLAILMWSIKVLKAEYNMKKKVNYQFVEGDMHWENNTIISMTIIALIGKFS